jgi:hypothetical protein
MAKNSPVSLMVVNTTYKTKKRSNGSSAIQKNPRYVFLNRILIFKRAS